MKCAAVSFGAAAYPFISNHPCGIDSAGVIVFGQFIARKHSVKIGMKEKMMLLQRRLIRSIISEKRRE